MRKRIQTLREQLQRVQDQLKAGGFCDLKEHRLRQKAQRLRREIAGIERKQRARP